jgi:uncharacterized protein (TIGR00369 family)
VSQSAEVARIQELVDAAPFGPWWGLRVESAGANVARVRLPFRPELQRLGGILHGAGTTCVADVAVWAAVIATVPGGEHAVTTHLATDYLAPARGDVIAHARLLRVGRRSAVGICETRTEDDTLVAFHTVTYALPAR